MERLISFAIIDRKEAYTETIIYPQIIIEFLKSKMRTKDELNFEMIKNSEREKSKPNMIFKKKKKDSFVSNFDSSLDIFDKNEESLHFLTLALKSLLEIKVSRREEKKKIITSMINDNIINEDSGRIILQQKIEMRKSLSPSWILRKTFFSNTSEKLVKKLEIDWFSKIYGEEFKEINNVTVRPLLLLESKLTYSLINALRHQNIEDSAFWKQISKIESDISSKLLKKGSIFKFVYQINSIAESWFTVKVKENGQVKIHFIKNGIWIYNQNMKADNIYIAKDIFFWRELQEEYNKGDENKNIKAQLIKMLFQSFESLAFCLEDDEKFWSCDPKEHVYDFFGIYKNVEETTREYNHRFSISKIMFFVLSNERTRVFEGRNQPLKYNLSDIRIENNPQEEEINRYNSFENQIKYKLDFTEEEILQKFKKLENMNNEEIEESEGLPYVYIVNLLEEITDILKIYEINFVERIERICNQKEVQESGKDSLKINVQSDLKIEKINSEYSN